MNTKKTLNNYMIVTVLNIINAPDSFWQSPDKRPHLKVSVPVRRALKMNLKLLEEYGKNYTEMYQDIVNDLQRQFISAGKAEQTEEEFKVLPEYLEEYNNELGSQLTELLQQEVEVNLYAYSAEDLDKYGELNGEYLTEMEMDVLELFLDDPKEETNE